MSLNPFDWTNFNNDGSSNKMAEGWAKPRRDQTPKGGSGRRPEATWGAPEGGGGDGGIGTGTPRYLDGGAGKGGRDFSTAGISADDNTRNQSPFAASNQWGIPKDGSPAPAGVPGAAGGAATGGTQSGPGILQNWFNQRAGGTDPSWLYGTGRAEDAINRRYAASGGYNSSGANQSVSDMYANAISQRQGQLDQLAGGASGEHQGQLDSMFKYGLGIADAQAKTTGSYDTATASSQQQAKIAQIQLMLNKGEIDAKTAQAMINQAMSFAGTAVSAYGATQGKK